MAADLERGQSPSPYVQQRIAQLTKVSFDLTMYSCALGPGSEFKVAWSQLDPDSNGNREVDAIFLLNQTTLRLMRSVRRAIMTDLIEEGYRQEVKDVLKNNLKRQGNMDNLG